MSAKIIPFPQARRSVQMPHMMWRVEGDGRSVLVEDTREAIYMLRDGWKEVVLVEQQPDGTYATARAAG